MDNKLYKLMNWPRIEGIIYSEEDNPFEILGPHSAGKNTLFQTFIPGAEEVYLVFSDGKRKKMEEADEEGYFVCLINGKAEEEYEYEAHFSDGVTETCKDAYRYRFGMDKKETDKWNTGTFYQSYDRLGAHPMTLQGTEGVFFAVWAPNAIRVSVVGEFNHQDGRRHQMQKNPENGIFELFIPEVKAGDTYLYEVKSRGGQINLKADPYAFGWQLRPEPASVVRDISSYQWQDEAFIKERKKRQDKNMPVSVYELYPGSFKRDKDTGECLNYRALAVEVAAYAKEMGYTHVELMPIMEHSMDASFGYQITGYYAPTSRYGSAEDFMFFVDTLHKEGIGVILDWVPSYFSRDDYGLGRFDGTCLYEHLDPRQGVHPQLGTLLYNYGRPQVSGYLISNALYWVEKYHVDGLRIHSAASMLYLDYGRKDGEWVANIYGGNENLEAIEFLKHLNSIMKKRNPGVYMIAEEAMAWPKVTAETEDGGLGFDMKWNTGFMKDYLSYISYDPYFRAHHHNELTFSMIYQYSENFMTVFPHEEAMHGRATMLGKMPGNEEDKFANLRLTYGYMMTHPGKKLLFMGQDIAEYKEFDETRQTEWSLLQQGAHKGINQLVKDLNFLYKEKPALYEKDTFADGFEWINCISGEKCMVSFVRKAEKAEDMLLIVANFAGIEQEFTVGVPCEGKYKELLNTDSKLYGGKSGRRTSAKNTTTEECDGRPYSISVKMAPLSLMIFSYMPYSKKEREEIEKQKAAREAALRAKEAEALAMAAKEEVKEARKAVEEAKKLVAEAEKKEKEVIERAKAAEAHAQKERENADNAEKAIKAQSRKS